KGGLFALSFGLDTEHCDAPRLAENPRDLVPRRHEMLPPALRHARRLAHLRGRGGPQGSTEIMTEFLLTDLLLGEHHLRTVLHLARLIVEARSDDVGAPHQTFFQGRPHGRPETTREPVAWLLAGR